MPGFWMVKHQLVSLLNLVTGFRNVSTVATTQKLMPYTSVHTARLSSVRVLDMSIRTSSECLLVLSVPHASDFVLLETRSNFLMKSYPAQNKGWKLVGHLFKVCRNIIIDYHWLPHSKFVLPNRKLLGYMVKWVGK